LQFGAIKAVIIKSALNGTWSVLGAGGGRGFQSRDDAVGAVEAHGDALLWKEITPGLWVARTGPD
jgi:hypothetical protein